MNCPYIEADFDINATYFYPWPPSELKDDAYVLHVEALSLEKSGQDRVTFVIGHNTSYMYFDGLNGTYRSKDAISSKFINLIKTSNSTETSTESN